MPQELLFVLIRFYKGKLWVLFNTEKWLPTTSIKVPETSTSPVNTEVTFALTTICKVKRKSFGFNTSWWFEVRGTLVIWCGCARHHDKVQLHANESRVHLYANEQWHDAATTDDWEDSEARVIRLLSNVVVECRWWRRHSSILFSILYDCPHTETYTKKWCMEEHQIALSMRSFSLMRDAL